MSEWITDRLPTVEDAVHYCVLLWDQDEGVLIWSYDGVNEGQPWVPISTPAPYVKPKRWTVEYNRVNGYWVLVAGRLNVPLYYMTTDDVYPAAQRIADVYNEVMP
jgi:hypothetical protein